MQRLTIQLLFSRKCSANTCSANIYHISSSSSTQYMTHVHEALMFVTCPCMSYTVHRARSYNEKESHVRQAFCPSLFRLSSNGVLCNVYVLAVRNFTRYCRLSLPYNVTGFWRSRIHCENKKNWCRLTDWVWLDPWVSRGRTEDEPESKTQAAIYTD